MLVLVCDSCRETCTQYVCELCKKNGKHFASVPVTEDDESQLQSTGIEIQTVSFSGISSMRKLRILCLHGFRQNASSFKGRTASLAKKLRNIAELVFIDAPHELPFIFQPSQQSSPPPGCTSKFAWLVAPNFNGKSDCNWKMADSPFDLLQYQQQTDGFDVSLLHLKTVFSQLGPFDGMLGFSQGAAMVASVCAQGGRLKDEMDFRFVILCSGFAFNFAKYNHGSINCPSLHIFGNSPGKDRQIDVQASKDLASLFEEGCSEIIEHDCGHIIPTRSPYIDKMKDFLQRFL